jgi:hypothetical protein
VFVFEGGDLAWILESLFVDGLRTGDISDVGAATTGFGGAPRLDLDVDRVKL